MRKYSSPSTESLRIGASLRGEREHRLAAIREIVAAVRSTRGSVRGAAALLGVGWRTIKRWVADHPDLRVAVWRITRLRWAHRPRGAKMRRSGRVARPLK